MFNRERVRELTNKLETWFSIDKIKSYAVYVWTKGDEGENIFDIFNDYIQFYSCENLWQMPAEAISIIQEIQFLLEKVR